MSDTWSTQLIDQAELAEAIGDDLRDNPPFHGLIPYVVERTGSFSGGSPAGPWVELLDYTGSGILYDLTSSESNVRDCELVIDGGSANIVSRGIVSALDILGIRFLTSLRVRMRLSQSAALNNITTGVRYLGEQS